VVVKVVVTMTPPQHKAGHRKHGRSAAQREWTACVAAASRAWEYLTDKQRLPWNERGKSRRTSGQRDFVKINAPRFRDGQPMLTELPSSEAPPPRGVLKRLLITNRRRRVRLWLEVSPPPNARFTVWGSRPCNQGISAYHKCPRLGPLPETVNGWSEITGLYFKKHGGYIETQLGQIVGKRIVIRLRQELEAGPTGYEEVRAVVPPPEDRARRPKRG
jgi:hypothetical protein